MSRPGCEVRAIPAASCFVDVSDPRSARSMVTSCLDEFGTVDVLVNNAGIDAPPGAAWEIPEEHWRRLIDTNLLRRLCGEPLPVLRRRRRRSVLAASCSSARGALGSETGNLGCVQREQGRPDRAHDRALGAS